jgi:DNA-binding MarR family transcriptional regulator
VAPQGESDRRRECRFPAVAQEASQMNAAQVQSWQQSAPALPAKLVREPPVRIDAILTKEEFVALARHMMNGNPLSHFLTIWRDEDGEAQFAKAKPSKNALTHAGWSYDTIQDKAKIKTAFGLYPKNQDNTSTFAALDFDAHSGNDELARGRAIRAFSLLLEYRDRYLILSASGRGYHVFVFAHEARPVAEWTHLLEDVVSTIPTPIQDGQCELFPSARTGAQKLGRPIRMPGAYNPKTDKAEMIIAETIRPLLDRLKVANSSTLITNENSPRKVIRDKETNSYSYTLTSHSLSDGKAVEIEQKAKTPKIASKTVAKSFISTSTDGLVAKVIDKFPILMKSTRNGILLAMAGELFVKFGWELSKLIVEEHYKRNEVNVSTPFDVHMREFAYMWQHIFNKTLASLSGPERSIYDALGTLPQQEAFLLIRAFAHLHKGNDFPVAQSSLADRIGVTQPGAKKIIEKLIELKAVVKTADARVNSRPAFYHWTAGIEANELPFPGINTAF